MNRKKLFSIIELAEGPSAVISRIYDSVMLLMIIISIIPLMFKEQTVLFIWFDRISVSMFILDYILRWMTDDIRRPHRKKGVAFATYPFTLLAILDLLSILPSIGIFNRALKVLRVIRLFKLIRVLRFLRYSRRINMLMYVLKKERVVLLTVLGIAFFYIVATALIMFNVEMYVHTEEGKVVFDTFFDALYWATTTLTTVGYGDIYPVSDIGRIVSMISSLFGVAVIALPSGVITASYLEELRKKKEESDEDKK